MIILIIIVALMYVIVGMGVTSEVIGTTKRFETEEEKQDSAYISEKNWKLIRFLLLAGLILGVIGMLVFDLSWKAGIAILIGSFIAGVIIRIVMQKNL